jgi:hypothetical protein
MQRTDSASSDANYNRGSLASGCWIRPSEARKCGRNASSIDPNPDSFANTHKNANANSFANTHKNANANSFANTHKNANANSNSNSKANTDPCSQPHAWRNYAHKG